MAAVTIRNLSPETHRALKLRAAQNGRSTEAEIREILDTAVKPTSERTVAEILDDLRRDFDGVEFEFVRDKTPAEPIKFE